MTRETSSLIISNKSNNINKKKKQQTKTHKHTNKYYIPSLQGIRITQYVTRL